jgi:DNA-directed RNA polymerase specialized sigma24 family protein
MSASIPRRDELEKQNLPGKRFTTRQEFLNSSLEHERELYKAAWALCDRADAIEELLEGTLLLTWEEHSRAAQEPPLRKQLARKLIEFSRTMRENGTRRHVNRRDGEYTSPSSEVSARAHRGIRSLPWDCREAFVLRDVLGFSGLECSELLRISHENVRQLISNARLQMTRELSGAAAMVGGGK